MITLNDEVSSKLPADFDAAQAMANEILAQVLLSREEPSAQLLQNRPDWQQEIALSREQWASGDVVAHEEVLDWKRQQRE